MQSLPQVVLGVGLIMGDGVLTPAVTVVSAVEGLQIATSGVTHVMIIGISCAIIAALFAVQKVRVLAACQFHAAYLCIRPRIEHRPAITCRWQQPFAVSILGLT